MWQQFASCDGWSTREEAGMANAGFRTRSANLLQVCETEEVGVCPFSVLYCQMVWS